MSGIFHHGKKKKKKEEDAAFSWYLLMKWDFFISEGMSSHISMVCEKSHFDNDKHEVIV